MVGQEFELRGQQASSGPWSAGRVAVYLFAAFCCIYLGTARGVLDTVDDVAMLRVTEALVRDGSFAVASDTPGAMLGRDGRWYTRYGIGQSLLAIPFYLVGSRAPVEAPLIAPYDPHGFVRADPVAFSVTFIGLLCCALTVALVYLTCRALHIGHVGALAAALALGLGTFAWHYARTFMSEPPSMLATALAFYALLRYRNGGPLRWAFVSGLAGAALVLFRVGNAVLLPALFVWLLWPVPGQRSRPAIAWVLWLMPLVACGAALAVFNAVRFGSPLETGYADQAQAFATPLYVGAYGLLVSSGKGLFIYAPILLAGVVGWVRLAHRQPLEAAAIGLLVAAYVGFYARFDWWYGGGPWGPRFLLVILPLVVVGVGALVHGRLASGAVVALAALATVSVGVQVLSLAVPYLPYEAQMVQDEKVYERLLWNPAYSPILIHARSLIRHDVPLDFAFTYYPWPWLAWLQSGGLLAGFGLLLAMGRSTLLPRRRTLARSAATPA